MIITQDTVNDLIFYQTSTKPFFLLCAENRCKSCEEVVKCFNAVNTGSTDCPLQFEITEVGEGGAEDLDDGKVRLNPPGSWDLSLYGVNAPAEKDPAKGTFIKTVPLKVIWDNNCNIF